MAIPISIKLKGRGEGGNEEGKGGERREVKRGRGEEGEKREGEEGGKSN